MTYVPSARAHLWHNLPTFTGVSVSSGRWDTARPGSQVGLLQKVRFAPSAAHHEGGDPTRSSNTSCLSGHVWMAGATRLQTVPTTKAAFERLTGRVYRHGADPKVPLEQILRHRTSHLYPGAHPGTHDVLTTNPVKPE